MRLTIKMKVVKNMNKISFKSENDKYILYFTIPIVILIAACSSIGVWYPKLYFNETADWLPQCIGQDVSNLFFISPILLVSGIYASRGNKTAKIIWIGTMITTVYAYIIYCFDVHFNFLFHEYCIILGLSVYSVLIFFIKNINEDFKKWFTEKAPTKTIGIFIFLVALMFTFLWLSDSIPATLNNTVPNDIIKDGLLTSPVKALDFSFYFPLMYISSVMVIKKKVVGYLLAPMMLIFDILTNINIICLMIVSMQNGISNNTPQIIVFSIFTIICLVILWLFVKNISESSQSRKNI